MTDYEQALDLCRNDPESAALQITVLLGKVSELELAVAKLSKNSTNSSKPPSSDITRPKSQQKQEGKRKIGAQSGHPRHERVAFAESEIQVFHEYHIATCPECGNTDLVFRDEPPRVLQQMELKPIVIQKEAHYAYPAWCADCQKIHYHPFPSEVVKEGLFKERLTALVTYMKAVDHPDECRSDRARLKARFRGRGQGVAGHRAPLSSRREYRQTPAGSSGLDGPLAALEIRSPLP